MCLSAIQHASILEVSRVLSRAACRRIWVSMRTLKALKQSECLISRNAWKLFSSFLLMLSSDRSVEPHFLEATYVVPTSIIQKLERFPYGRMLEVIRLSLFRCCSHCRKGYTFEYPNRGLDPNFHTQGSEALNWHGNLEQSLACHYPRYCSQWTARSRLSCATTDALWNCLRQSLGFLKGYC